jgi:hypothetical protein
MSPYGDILDVPGYRGFFGFGSVAGSAASNLENTEKAIQRARDNGHDLVFAYGLASIIDNSGKTAAEKAMEGAPAGATLHTLALGSLVWFEGQTYRLDKASNRNVKLTPVKVWTDGQITEGVI